MMPDSSFAIIGSAWLFYKKHSALNSIWLWLLTVPLSAMLITAEYSSRNPYFLEIKKNGVVWGVTDMRPMIAFVLAMALLAVIITWGVSCVLVVGKRLITSKAGRSRTSFRSVSKEAREFIIPMVITDVLRDLLTVIFGLFLIVPGVIFAVRTSFYRIAMVARGAGCADSLKTSREIVMGNTLKTLMYLIGIFLYLFVPSVILSGALIALSQYFLPQGFFPIALLLVSAILGFAEMIYLISMVILYGEIGRLPKNVSVFRSPNP